jgi:hypothetical protein
VLYMVIRGLGVTWLCGNSWVGCHVALRLLVGGSPTFRLSRPPRNTAVTSRSRNSGDVFKNRMSEFVVKRHGSAVFRRIVVPSS